MQKDTNQQKARDVLAEHRDRLACALFECAWLEQLAHDGERAIAGEQRPSISLGVLRAKLRHALATCDELADVIDDGEHDATDTRDTVRATFGDCTVEVKVPDMARPLTAWLQWLQTAADFTNRVGG